MSHIDTGTLHEYLDGGLSESRQAEVQSHLAGCEACRTSLEEARDLSRRSSALLAELEPGPAQAPPWSEIAERAAARTPSTRTHGWRLNRFAWAATIAFAFAIGWASSGFFGQLTELTPTEIATSAAERSADLDASLSPKAGTEPTSTTESGARLSRQSELSDAGTDIVPTVFTAQEATPATVLRETRAEARVDRSLEQASLEPAPAPAIAADKSLADAVSVAGARMAEEEELRSELPAGDAVHFQLAATAEDAEEELWIDALSKKFSRERAAYALYRALNETERREVQAAAATLFFDIGAEEAARRMGGALRRLPDLELKRIEVVPGGALPDGIVGQPAIRQVYEDAAGHHIVLLQQLEEKSAKDESDGGTPALTVSPTGRIAYRWTDAHGYRLILIASVSADSLRALADRVR